MFHKIFLKVILDCWEIVCDLLCLLIAELLQKVWDTELLCDVSMFGSMVLVALPYKLVGGATGSLTYADAEQIQDVLHHQFKIEVWQVNSITVLFSKLVLLYCVYCVGSYQVYSGEALHTHFSTHLQRVARVPEISWCSYSIEQLITYFICSSTTIDNRTPYRIRTPSIYIYNVCSKFRFSSSQYLKNQEFINELLLKL